MALLKVRRSFILEQGTLSVDWKLGRALYFADKKVPLDIMMDWDEQTMKSFVHWTKREQVMRLWSRERHRSVRLGWCLIGAKVDQAEMANLQGFFQVEHSCEIWKTRSTDNLCLPFAVYLCPKTFKPFMMYNLSGVQCQQICCVHISTTLLHLIHPAAGPGTMLSWA